MASGSKLTRAYLIGAVFWVVVFYLSLRTGAVRDADLDVLVQLRLPRAILASAVGIGLSVAGAALQALFSNPLCEPYTLGISSGSALGAVIGGVLGIHWAVGGLAGSAFIGAIVFMVALHLISLRAESGNHALLLGGVMLGFLGSSLVSVWMAFADPNGVQAAIAWLLGDLSRARLSGSALSLASAIGLSLLIWTRSRELDALLMGEEAASSMGVDVSASRRKIMLVTSLLVALTVSGAGMIGFVGLVVPHFTRRFAGALHFKLLPLCALWGAGTVTAADLLARVLARPYELPVGAVTGLIGAPVFLWILLQKRSEVAT